jgi:hypothetical protein
MLICPRENIICVSFVFLGTDSYFVFASAITSACSLSRVFSFFALVFQSNIDTSREKERDTKIVDVYVVENDMKATLLQEC